MREVSPLLQAIVNRGIAQVQTAFLWLGQQTRRLTPFAGRPCAPRGRLDFGFA
jgi:hypothetical protein